MKNSSPELSSGVSPQSKTTLGARLRGLLLDRFATHGHALQLRSESGPSDGSDGEEGYEEEFEAEGPGGVCFLLLDHSGSMTGANKLGSAKRGAVEFWHEAAARGYATGLVVFDHQAELLVAPGDDLGAFTRALSDVIPAGGTAMVHALGIALRPLLDSTASERAVVLFTDGQTADREKCIELADIARRAGIRIICRGTHDADRVFLALLATDDGLVETVDDSAIAQTIASAARQLPAVSEGTR